MNVRCARLLPAVLVLMVGCATANPAWRARSVPACSEGMGDPRLDQERMFLAALLALDARGYALLSTKPLVIEAEFVSSHRPSVSRTRWLLRVLSNGALEIDAPPQHRKTHQKTESWYQRLTMSVAQYRCRELEWLRWEAQNRGLLAIADDTGVPMSSVLPGATDGASGGEAPSSPDDLDSASTVRERREQLRRLYVARSELHLGRQIAGGAVGVGLAAIGSGLMVQGWVFYLQRCSSVDASATEGDACLPTRAARAVAFTGLGIHLTGALVIGITFPRLFSRLRRYKALGREIKLLKATQLSLGVMHAPLGLTWQASF